MSSTLFFLTWPARDTIMIDKNKFMYEQIEKNQKILDEAEIKIEEAEMFLEASEDDDAMYEYLNNPTNLGSLDEGDFIAPTPTSTSTGSLSDFYDAVPYIETPVFNDIPVIASADLRTPYGEPTVHPIGKPPIIIIPVDIMTKINYVIDRVDLEVGWICFATKKGNHITLTDIVVPLQDVHSATTEIRAEGMGAIITKLVKEGRIEDTGKIRCWGHSHNTMKCFPSAQDTDQFETLYEDVPDFFVMMIHNKNRELYAEVVDKVENVVYKHVNVLTSPFPVGTIDPECLQQLDNEIKTNVHRLKINTAANTPYTKEPKKSNGKSTKKPRRKIRSSKKSFSR